MKRVLLHAYPLDERMWEGFEGYAPRLYELGDAIEDWARAVLDSVQGDVVAVGASMGGYCALAMARLAPDRVRGLVLIGSRAEGDSPERRAARVATFEAIRSGGAAALWDEMAPRLFSSAAPPEAVARARQIALEQDPDRLARALNAIQDRPDSSSVVAEFGGPLLVMVGDDDPYLAVEEAQALARRAPDGRLEVFAGCGHLVPLEQPRAFGELLIDFLSDPAR